MTAGLNMRFNIWRMVEQTDDYVGGASLSGTCIHENVMGRLQQEPINQVFLEQGLETVKIFNAILVPANLTLEERDELEVILPKDHYFYGDKFRVESVIPADHNIRDPRNYLMVQLTRSVKAHRQQ